jgi:signal transduction histidine kinase/CheY-like chemotaxis protein
VSHPYAKDLLRKDGTRVPVLAGGARFDESGEIGVFYILDLTERRRVEEQAQAAQRLEAVGRLAGGVAHEINNALQSVLGFNRYVLKALSPDHVARPDADQVQTAAMRAATITRQLLTYSRQQVLQPADIDLAQLIEAFTPMLRQALGPERELEIRLAGGRGRGYAVHADRVQLEQVLLNLALNARDAMPGYGRLTLELDRLDVTAEWLATHPGVPVEPGPFVQLTLADTGTGMDPAVLPRIFEPFFTTKPPGQGTGLGLSVVYGIVKQSGGQVWAESAPGQGTRIAILLPVVSAPAANTDRPSAATPNVAGTETVLVVDDDALVLAVITSALTEAGYRVITASNGQEALERLDGHDGQGHAAVALVVTDLAMPVMSGRTLAHALAARRPELPVLFMSGYPGDTAEHQGLMDAGSDHVAKPFSPGLLCERVRLALDRRRRTVGGA